MMWGDGYNIGAGSSSQLIYQPIYTNNTTAMQPWQWTQISVDGQTFVPEDKTPAIATVKAESGSAVEWLRERVAETCASAFADIAA